MEPALEAATLGESRLEDDADACGNLPSITTGYIQLAKRPRISLLDAEER